MTQFRFERFATKSADTMPLLRMLVTSSLEIVRKFPLFLRNFLDFAFFTDWRKEEGRNILWMDHKSFWCLYSYVSYFRSWSDHGLFLTFDQNFSDTSSHFCWNQRMNHLQIAEPDLTFVTHFILCTLMMTYRCNIHVPHHTDRQPTLQAPPSSTRSPESSIRDKHAHPVWPPP